MIFSVKGDRGGIEGRDKIHSSPHTSRLWIQGERVGAQFQVGVCLRQLYGLMFARVRAMHRGAALPEEHMIQADEAYEEWQRLRLELPVPWQV